MIMKKGKKNCVEHFEVGVRLTFSAAHRLRNYGTKCEKLHGHNWIVSAFAGGNKLDSKGICMDFKELKSSLRKVLDELDHTFLNNVKPFHRINPSAENIAKFVFERLEPMIIKRGVELLRVEVSESEGCWAVYSKRGRD